MIPLTSRFRRILSPLHGVAMLLLLAPVACAPLPRIPYAPDADLVPPGIVEIGFQSARQLAVVFDEPCRLVEDSLLAGPTLSANRVTAGLPGNDDARGVSRNLLFTFSAPPDPATEHSVEAQVADPAGNHLRFVARFHGLNELLPAMIINEFTTQGSATHPDFVEIRVLTDGNLAGACLYEGTPEEWSDRFILPDLSVQAGDFIIVHFKPEGIPAEVNEVTARDISGGIDASDAAWDFWVDEGDGLSGNNGTITLCENPIGGVLDAVLYSNRTRDSDERYRGFGSTSVMAAADYLAEEEAWKANGELYPEDAIDPEDSTATRSISRSSSGADSNTKDDWHITPTRGLTPGASNNDDIYVR